MFKRLILSHALRRRVSWIIAAVLILPFVLFFHATGQAPVKGPGGIAGTLFGKPISWDQFIVQRRWLQRQFEERFHQAPELLDAMLARYTWERIMLIEEAKRQRLHVDDAQLAVTLERQPAFQDQGRFVPERYDRYVRSMGMSPQAFEALLRDDLLIGKLLDSVKAAVTVTDADVKAAYTQAHERLKATVITVDAAAWSSQAEAAITDDDVRAFYDAHQEQVRVPEQVIVEYVGTSKEELASRVSLDGEALRAFYQEHLDQFSTPAGTPQPFDDVREKVRQLFTDERARKQMTLLALDVQDDLDSKLRLEEISAAHALPIQTVGPIAAETFWMPKGPDLAILQAVRGLPEGRLSEVIRSERGVYLARVVQRTAARIPPLEEVRNQVRSQLIEERARQAAQQAAQAWRTRVRERQAAGWRYEEIALIEGALKAHPATFNRTEPVEGLGSVPAVNEAAFGTPLGSLTELVETPNGFALVRPEERLPADESSFAQQETTLRQETLGKRQSEAVEQWMQQLRDRAKLHSFLDPPLTPPSAPTPSPR